MQLNESAADATNRTPRPNSGISRQRQLTAAVLGLLGATGAQAEPGDDAPTQVDSGLLYYQENGNRVRDAEAIIAVRQPLSDARAWNLRLLFDTVCGGSPIGALPSKNSQTFATPNHNSLIASPTVQGGGEGQTTTGSSGGGGGLGSMSLCSNPVQGGVYTVAPTKLPIDQSFQDQRVSISGGYESSIGSNNKFTVGGALSHETDFLSGSLNGSLARDFNAHNTTVTLGGNLEYDQVSPIGGAPVPLSQYDLFMKQGNKHKQVEDVLLGVTQVMTRRWLTQLNVSVDREIGYLNDPYKIVSEVDGSGNNVTNTQGNNVYFFENRPSHRYRTALYWDNKYAFDHDVLQLSYRHMIDNWGIHSDTLETHYRFAMGSAGYLEPHWRGYRQSAADFFHPYVQAAPTSGYVSADARLAQFDAQTIGLKYGFPLSSTSELSMRLERYTQHVTAPTNLPALQGLNLFPDLRTWIIQAGLRFEF